MVDKHKLVEVLSKALPNWSFNEQSFIGPGIRRRVPTDALVEIVNGLEASKQSELVPSKLHTFLDAAAGEGLVLDGIDAADLYEQVFPERYAAALTPGANHGR